MRSTFYTQKTNTNLMENNTLITSVDKETNQMTQVPLKDLILGYKDNKILFCVMPSQAVGSIFLTELNNLISQQQKTILYLIVNKSLFANENKNYPYLNFIIDKNNHLRNEFNLGNYSPYATILVENGQLTERRAHANDYDLHLDRIGSLLLPPPKLEKPFSGCML